ncbi:MAG: hypothetical protein AABY22_27795, partial [Nanoarchaeota archaeon]
SETSLRTLVGQFIHRGNSLPIALEGLAPTINAPKTHVLVCFPVSQKMFNDFKSPGINIPSISWILLDSERDILIEKSANVINSPNIGVFWNVDGFVQSINLVRKRSTI